MKEELKIILSKVKEKNKKRLILREYLQAKILKHFQDAGLFYYVAFLGGTALRFLYSLKRFSEDLDFSVIQKEKPEFNRIIKLLRDRFEIETYDVSLKLSEKGNVKNAFLKFNNLLYELGLTGHKNEILSIKIEIDYNPPEGGKVVTSLVRKYFLLNIKHYDLDTMFSGKLNAIFTRGWTKGRDVYDLFWYLTLDRKIRPNFKFLNNALSQFNLKIRMDEKNWKEILIRKIDKLKWNDVVKDLEPFLEDQDEIKIITKENLIKLIQNY